LETDISKGDKATGTLTLEAVEGDRGFAKIYNADLCIAVIEAKAFTEIRRKAPRLQAGDVEAVRCRFHPPLDIQH